MFTRLGDTHHAAETEAYAATWLVNHDRSLDALQRAKHAYLLITAEPPSPTKAYSTLVVGRVASERGDPTCFPYILEGVQMARDLGSDELLARAMMTLGDEQLARDDPSGISDIEECLTIARRLRSSMSALARLSIFYDYVALGRLQDAATISEEGLGLARDMGLTSYLHALERQRATLAFIVGEWDRASDIAETAPQSLATDAVYQDIEETIAIRAVLALSAGDAERARRDADLTTALCNREGGIPKGGAAATCAYVYTTLQDWEQAAELTRMWLDVARAGRAFNTSFAWPLLAHVFCRLDRQSELLQVISDIRIRTPWLEAAAKLTSGDTAAATRILTTLGASRLAALATGLSPAVSAK